MKDVQMAAAIFDMDGTMLDSMSYWHRLELDFLHRQGIDLNDHMRDRLLSLGFAERIVFMQEELVPEMSDDEIREQMARIIHNNYNRHIALKPGVGRYLQTLKDRGVKMAVATMTSHKYTDKALDRLGILPYFDTVLTYEDAGVGKQEPVIYNMAAQRLGFDAGDCVVYEDLLQPAQTAKDAGYRVCGVYDDEARGEWDEICRICDFTIENYERVL